MINQPIAQPSDLSLIPHTQWQALQQTDGGFEIIDLREFHIPGLPIELFNQETGLWEIAY